MGAVVLMESWKDIQGYEGLYQVSNLGRIKSLERVVANNKNGGVRTVEEKILTPTDNGNGYKLVGLNKNRHRKNHYVHRLVAVAFVSNPTQAEYVNHIDYNRENNKANNLEWCTQKENIQHSIEHLRKPHRTSRQTNTGHKYIYLRNDKYRVCVPNKKERRFNTLEKALDYRGVFFDGR